MNRCGAVFIAALNGSALGIGSELALACDYRLMADGDHVIGQPEILLGFPPGGGGTQRLVRLVGTHQGLKRMLDGGGLSPEDAAEIGYVDEVVPADELIDRAVALGDHLAQRLKLTVAAVKRSAYIGGSLGLEDGLHLENAEFLSTLASPGAQEAMLAYMKRTEETRRPAALRPTDLRPDARGRSLRPARSTDPMPADAHRRGQTTPTRTIDVGGTAFAYRELGPRGGTPLVFLHHFTAVLDDWDPRVIDGIAAHRHVITFDNRGVGATGGKVPHTIAEMAADATAFIRALGHEHVDLLGFSLGGGVAQEVALDASRARAPADPDRHRRARRRRADEDAADRRRRLHQGRADARRPTALPVLQPQPDRQARGDRVHRPPARTHDRPRQADLPAGASRPAPGDPRSRPRQATRPQPDHPADVRRQRRQRRHGRQQPVPRTGRADPQRQADDLPRLRARRHLPVPPAVRPRASSSSSSTSLPPPRPARPTGRPRRRSDHGSRNDHRRRPRHPVRLRGRRRRSRTDS